MDVHALATIAHKKPRHSLARYYYPYAVRVHRQRAAWNDDTIIAHNTARGKGAQALLNLYSITYETRLNRVQAQYLICHRLVIKLPFLPTDAYCSRECGKIPKRHELPPTHHLYGTFRHGWHQSSCTKHPTVTYRHDKWLHVLKDGMRRHTNTPGYSGQYLNRDYATRKSTDLLLIREGEEWPFALDYTCGCAHLQEHKAAALVGLLSMFEEQVRKKDKKHAHYCHKSRRIFMAVPANTQGSFGTERFWNFWDAQWARAILADQIAGGTGMELGMHKQLLLAALHAVQVTHTTTHIISLNEDR